MEITIFGLSITDKIIYRYFLTHFTPDSFHWYEIFFYLNIIKKEEVYMFFF